MKVLALSLAFSCAAVGSNLWRAVSSGDPARVEAEFNSLEDFSVTNEVGLTLLGHAVYLGNLPVVEALLRGIRRLSDPEYLRRSVNPAHRSDTRSALYLAVVLNRPQILQALIEAGADVDYLFNVGLGDFHLRDRPRQAFEVWGLREPVMLRWRRRQQRRQRQATESFTRKDFGTAGNSGAQN